MRMTFVVCDAADGGGADIPVVMAMSVNIRSSSAKPVNVAESWTFSSTSSFGKGGGGCAIGDVLEVDLGVVNERGTSLPATSAIPASCGVERGRGGEVATGLYEGEGEVWEGGTGFRGKGVVEDEYCVGESEVQNDWEAGSWDWEFSDQACCC
jgi:hypothetical protein